MSVIMGGLVPHPPILVPELGQDRLRAISSTRKALQKLCRQVLASGARRLVPVTPHGPYQRDRMSCLFHPQLEGDFSPFGYAGVRQSWPCDEGFCRLLAENHPHMQLLDAPLDHALMVPLYYLRQQGFCEPLCALSVSGMSLASHVELGALLARLAGTTPTVVLASGDLSHRLKADGPYGFDENGPLFDEQALACLVPPNPKQLLELPTERVRRAGVCGLKPLLVALGALPPRAQGEVLSYEGPFGVGYAVALFSVPQAPP